MSRWDREYRSLPADARAAVNELVNTIFRDKTGFTGKVDPHLQPQLAARWIEIRDQVMANRHAFAQWLGQTASAISDYVQAIPIFNLLDTTPAWIRIARGELGQHSAAGEAHNPRIMQYIRTCTNLLGTEKQRQYVERNGEHGVEWCSAFVNWCLQQAGITGTDNALAASWADWGTKLTLPRQGAIVCFSWNHNSHIDHVAFCDSVGDSYKCLGGNQTGNGGQVSSVRFSTGAATHYRWPANA